MVFSYKIIKGFLASQKLFVILSHSSYIMIKTNIIKPVLESSILARESKLNIINNIVSNVLMMALVYWGHMCRA